MDEDLVALRSAMAEHQPAPAELLVGVQGRVARSRRRRTAGAVGVAAAVVVAVVVALAVGARPDAAPMPALTPVPSAAAHDAPRGLAPQLVVPRAGRALVLYDACPHPDCRPRAYARGPRGWQALTLPTWLQGKGFRWVAEGRLVALLDHQDRGAMSGDDGTTWVRAGAPSGTTIQPGPLVTGAGSFDGTLTLDPALGTVQRLVVAAPFTNAQVSRLADGRLWALAGRLGTSTDGGRTWRTTALPSGEAAGAPVLGRAGELVEVTGGAGAGEAPALHVLRSDAPTWRTTALAGPRVLARSTVALDDGTLLAPGVDGGLYRLTTGSRSFRRTDGPVADLDLLARTGSELWGLQRDGRRMWTADARRLTAWTAVALPED